MVSLQSVDRVPVVLEYAAFAAYVTGVPVAEFVRSPVDATRTMIQACRCVGEGNAVNYGSFSPFELRSLFSAKRQ